ncbi:hypothetical protein [Salinibacter ruber]|uniref:hypothetical protein n=1 Tax=Salinibacter ruber TaxID=146919 RepID=UPI0013C362C3|nr:hypothetical protein [Salinibacter ruber]
MSNDESTSTDEWIRNITTVNWDSTFPTHCLSGRYQTLNPQARGAPLFRENSFRSRIEASLGELDEGETIKARTEHLEYSNRVVELTFQARDQYRDQVEQGGGANQLRKEIERLRRDAEKTASQIDRDFKVTRVRSQSEVQKLRDRLQEYPLLASNTDTSKHYETNVLKEILHFLRFLDQADEEKADCPLRDMVGRNMGGRDITIEEKRWCVRYEDSPSAKLISSRPQRDGFDLLHPLAKSEIRPCINISSLGFEVGLSHFPADATVEQAYTYFWHFAKDAHDAADKYGNSHALLCLRLLVAREVHREYELYGGVEERTREEVEEHWVDQDHSSKKLAEPERLYGSLEVLLGNPDLRDRAWREEGGEYYPNGSGLHGLLVEHDKEVLRRDDAHSGRYAGKQTVRNYIDDLSSEKIEELRSEAGL